MSETTFLNIGADNHTNEERQNEDFYASDPRIISHLFNKMPELKFLSNIVEPCAGDGTLADQIEIITGKSVDKFDLIQRRGDIKPIDYFKLDIQNNYDLIITNPPYKRGSKTNPGLADMIVKMLKDVKPGGYVALFLKTIHLESQERYNKIFSTMPPEKIFVYAPRVSCYKNNNQYTTQGAISYSWFIWHKQIDGTFINKPVELSWIDKL